MIAYSEDGFRLPHWLTPYCPSTAYRLAAPALIRRERILLMSAQDRSRAIAKKDKITGKPDKVCLPIQSFIVITVRCYFSTHQYPVRLKKRFSVFFGCHKRRGKAVLLAENRHRYSFVDPG